MKEVIKIYMKINTLREQVKKIEHNIIDRIYQIENIEFETLFSLNIKY